MVQITRTHKIRRFLKVLGSLNSLNGDFRAYLKVSYGKGLNVFGKHTEFYNDGEYDNIHDLLLAFDAFKEESL